MPRNQANKPSKRKLEDSSTPVPKKKQKLKNRQIKNVEQLDRKYTLKKLTLLRPNKAFTRSSRVSRNKWVKEPTRLYGVGKNSGVICKCSCPHIRI